MVNKKLSGDYSIVREKFSIQKFQNMSNFEWKILEICQISDQVVYNES